MRKHKGIILAMSLLVIAVCICGCSKSKKSSDKQNKEGEFKVCSDNSFIVTYSEDFGEDYYSKDELGEMVDKELAEFNDNYAVSKGNGVTKDLLEVKDKVVKLKLKFSDYNDYNTYSANYIDSDRNARLFLGTYEEAAAEGYLLNTKFVRLDDSEELSLEDIKADSELYVLFTNEGLNISIEGTVVATGANVTVKDNIVKTSDKRENYVIYKLK